MSKIKTWHERCEEHPDHQTGMVSNSMIQARMQEEIDELRAALAEPVQEPVAGVVLNEEGRAALVEHGREEWHCVVRNARRLYTAPQQRNPVGWDGRCMLGHCNSPAGCENSGECRAVERAHGIKE